MTLFISQFNILSYASNEALFSSFSYFMLTVGIIAFLFFLYFDFTSTIKRLHDLNQSGWLSLLKLIPIVNFFFGLYLIIRPGDLDSNKYGSPRATPLVEKIFGWMYIISFSVVMSNFTYQYNFYKNNYLNYSKSFQEKNLEKEKL